MKITINQNAQRLNAIFHRLSRMRGVDLQPIIEQETEAILKATIRYTKAATVAAIRSHAEKREFGWHLVSRDPKRPFRGQMHKGKKRYYYRNRYPNAVWAEISRQRKASLASRIAARGISKRSWLLLAESLGFQIAVPRFVSAATTPRGPRPDNVSARRVNSGSDFTIFGVNRSPLIYHARMGAALNRAVVGRIKFFEKRMRKGVFATAQGIASAYPGAVTISQS